MASYLIDFENVGNEGLKGIELLEKEDTVHIFYNEAVSRLTFPMAEKIFRCKAQVRFFAASVGGNNALDFQLSSWLGYLYAKNGEEIYNIISRDKGFLHAAEFWRALKEVGEPKIYCWPSISLAQKKNMVETKGKETENIVEEPKETAENDGQIEKQNEGKEKIEEITENSELNVRRILEEQEDTEEIIEKKGEIEEKGEMIGEKRIEEKSAEEKRGEEKETEKKEIEEQKAQLGLKDTVHRILGKEIEETEEEKVCDLVRDSENKMDLYRMIVTKFGQKRGQEIYRGLKPEYNKMKRMEIEEIILKAE